MLPPFQVRPLYLYQAWLLSLLFYRHRLDPNVFAQALIVNLIYDIFCVGVSSVILPGPRYHLRHLVFQEISAHCVFLEILQVSSVFTYGPNFSADKYCGDQRSRGSCNCAMYRICTIFESIFIFFCEGFWSYLANWFCFDNNLLPVEQMNVLGAGSLSNGHVGRHWH